MISWDQTKALTAFDPFGKMMLFNQLDARKGGETHGNTLRQGTGAGARYGRPHGPEVPPCYGTGCWDRESRQGPALVDRPQGRSEDPEGFRNLGGRTRCGRFGRNHRIGRNAQRGIGSRSPSDLPGRDNPGISGVSSRATVRAPGFAPRPEPDLRDKSDMSLEGYLSESGSKRPNPVLLSQVKEVLQVCPICGPSRVRRGQMAIGGIKRICP